MKFNIKQSALKEALTAVQGALEKKSTIPVLSHVLIESIGENAIQVTATDLDITVRRTTEAEIVKAGRLCVTAQKLLHLVGNIKPDAAITLEAEKNHWALISSGKTKVRLAGRDCADFPGITKFKSTPIEFETAVFHKLLKRTAFIAANAESHRMQIQVLKVEATEGLLRMITTDGHRLALAETACDPGLTLDAQIPKRAFNDITRITSEKFRFGEDPKNLFIESDDTLITVRKVNGSFPNWKLVMPKDLPNIASVDRDELLAAAKRAVAFAEDSYHSLYMTFAPGGLELWTRTSENGEVDEEVAIEYRGEVVETGVQCPFLIDLCNLAEPGSKVRCEFRDGKSQLLFRFDGDDSFKYIIMPLTTRHSKRSELKAGAANAQGD